MARRKNWSAERIVTRLRQIEIQMAQGKSLALAEPRRPSSPNRAPGRVHEARDLLHLTRGAGGDRSMAPARQRGATSFVLGPSQSGQIPLAAVGGRNWRDYTLPKPERDGCQNRATGMAGDAPL